MAQALEYSHLGGSWDVCASNPISSCTQLRMLVTWAVRARVFQGFGSALRDSEVEPLCLVLAGVLGG